MATQRAGNGTSAKGGDPRFVIIGAGMSGILSAIKLQEAGLTDFTIYESPLSSGSMRK